MVDGSQSLGVFLRLDENKVPEKIREILKLQGISHLRTIQTMAIQEGLFEGADLLVCSPSASGKTLVGELAILKWVLEGGKAVYVAPLKALAREKFGILTRKYRGLNLRIRISTGDFHHTPDILEDADILVTTTERFDSLLRLNPNWLYDVRVIVVDEIHVMGEGVRGGRLESVLIRIRERLRVQLIGLSATIANAREVADWLGCRLIESDIRPVPLKNYVLTEPDKLEAIRKLVSKTVQSNGQALIFVAHRRDAESLARKLVDSVSCYLTEEEKVTLSSFAESKNYSKRLIELMRAGVGFHHAGLNHDSREIVEDAFRRGLLKVVCCTTTLSAGIDAPARLVILRDFYVYNRVEMVTEEFEVELMNANQFHQILGRAGRPNYDSVGYSVVLCDSDADHFMIRKKYFELKNGELRPKYDDVVSSIGYPPNLEEQILLRIFECEEASSEDILKFFEKTFWWRIEKSRNPHLSLEALVQVTSLNIPDAVVNHSEVSEFKAASRIRSENLRVQVLPKKVEATIKKPVVNVCSFDEEGNFQCTCSYHKREEKKLCRHLIKLAQFVDRNYPAYRGLISQCLNADNFLKKLVDEGLIVETTNGTFKPTNFGRLIMRLYLKPMTGIMIRSRVHEDIDDELQFLELVLSAAELEYGRPQPQVMGVAILDYINGKSIRAVSSLHAVSQGDLESVISSLNWMVHCVTEVASMEGAETVKKIGKSLEERIKIRREEKGLEIWNWGDD